jgi:hypothetical protein
MIGIQVGRQGESGTGDQDERGHRLGSVGLGKPCQRILGW